MISTNVFNSFCIVTLQDQCTVRGKAKEQNQEANRIWPTADRHWWHRRKNGFKHKLNCGKLHSAYTKHNNNKNKMGNLYQKICHSMNAQRNLSPICCHAVWLQVHTLCFRHNKHYCILSDESGHNVAESQVLSFDFKHLLETVLKHLQQWHCCCTHSYIAVYHQYRKEHNLLW